MKLSSRALIGNGCKDSLERQPEFIFIRIICVSFDKTNAMDICNRYGEILQKKTLRKMNKQIPIFNGFHQSKGNVALQKGIFPLIYNGTARK